MLIVFATIFSDIYQDNLVEKKKILAEDFGYSIQNEFLLAAQSEPGYNRTFIIPDKLEGLQYEIYNIGSALIINYTQGEIGFPIPIVNGSIQKGTNIITNNNNSICLNR
ncbi:hypothetical protein JW930_02720 [Candidatus Woesearchaeota archaeon]|nr:hypothetical protein [Candidatus Woesearchaeota archaeon]